MKRSFFSKLLCWVMLIGLHEPLFPIARVFEVMYNGELGVIESDKKVKFAEAKNLFLDLNMQEISARFECSTQMGKMFLQNIRMVSPKDTTGIVQNRQQIIRYLVEHPQALERFQSLIDEAVEHEQLVMKFMNKYVDMSAILEDPLKDPLGTIDYFTKKNIALNTYNQWTDTMGVVHHTVGLGTKFKELGDTLGEAYSANKSVLGVLSALSVLSLDPVQLESGRKGLYSTGAWFQKTFLNSPEDPNRKTYDQWKEEQKNKFTIPSAKNIFDKSDADLNKEWKAADWKKYEETSGWNGRKSENNQSLVGSVQNKVVDTLAWADKTFNPFSTGESLSRNKYIAGQVHPEFNNYNENQIEELKRAAPQIFTTEAEKQAQFKKEEWDQYLKDKGWKDKMDGTMFDPKISELSGKFTKTIMIPIAVYSAYKAGNNVYKSYTDALTIRNALYSLNRLIQISQELDTLCFEHNLANQFSLSSIQSPEGLQLLDDLQQPRYLENESNFIASPLVHSFALQVYEKDEYLAPVYASIAELDVYVAIARKFVTLQNADHKMCFAEILDESKPRFVATDFWNILVSIGQVVTNSIAEDRNIILTGSNEGGKTTAIRALLQNIVLAQTFGIAAASEFKFTPFDVVHSYLNISDDILNGKSRFASELKQAQDILERIKKLKPDEKFFFAFDELFTGTNGEDGAECAYRFIDNVASYSGIQFIYATHFNKLKEMEERNASCVNYKINPPKKDANGVFIRDKKGQLVYPYTLSKGANDTNVAMFRATDAGIFA